MLAYYIVLTGHALLTLFMAIGWVFNNPIVLKILFTLLITGIFLFFALGGCFISRIEKKLGGGDFTICDPILEKLGINIDRSSRSYITITIFMLSLFITSYKLFIRKDQDAPSSSKKPSPDFRVRYNIGLGEAS